MNYGILYFLIYMVIVAWLAYKGHKKTVDLKSFAIGSGDQSPLIVAITFAATFCSAGTFLGLTGQAYGIGSTVLWFPMGQWFPAMIGLAVMAKGYRMISGKMNSLSMADWIGDRYDSKFLRVFIALVTLLNITYVGAQFVGVGVVFNQMMGIPYTWGVVLGIGIVTAYIFAGGTYAHIYTNAFQGALMTVIAVVVVVSGLSLFPNILHTLPSKLHEIDPQFTGILNPNNAAYATPVAIIGIFVAHFFWGANPHLINKVQYLKTEKDIRKFILYTGLFMFLMGAVTFSGLYARVLIPDLPKADGALPALVNLIFPKAISAIFLVVLLAATMSTTDGLMVYLATVFGNTLYKETYMKMKELKGKPVDHIKVEKTALQISKWSVIIVSLMALPVAWSQPKFLIVLLWTGSCGVLSAVAGPIVMGIWSRKAHRKAAIVSSIVGLVGYLILFLGGITKSVYLAGAQGCLLGLVTMFVMSYVLSPSPDEKNAQFFESIA